LCTIKLEVVVLPDGTLITWKGRAEDAFQYLVVAILVILGCDGVLRTGLHLIGSKPAPEPPKLVVQINPTSVVGF
jgi:hypothetical protein